MSVKTPELMNILKGSLDVNNEVDWVARFPLFTFASFLRRGLVIKILSWFHQFRRTVTALESLIHVPEK